MVIPWCGDVRQCVLLLLFVAWLYWLDIIGRVLVMMTSLICSDVHFLGSPLPSSFSSSWEQNRAGVVEEWCPFPLLYYLCGNCIPNPKSIIPIIPHIVYIPIIVLCIIIVYYLYCIYPMCCWCWWYMCVCPSPGEFDPSIVFPSVWQWWLVIPGIL